MIVVSISLTELEQVLEQKKRRLSALQTKRSQLERQLISVIEKIGRIEGSRHRAKKLVKKTRHRAQNERTLKEVVTDLLSQNKKGLGLDELSKRVLATGYQTTSTNFKNTLYQTLYHHDQIELDNGLYRLV